MWNLLPSVCLNYDKPAKCPSFEYTWYGNLHFTEWKYLDQKVNKKYNGVARKCVTYKSLKI